MKIARLINTCLIVCCSAIAHGQIKLPKLISDGMILQRDIPLNIWGWAAAGEEVHLEFDKQTYKGKADEQGKWLITLPKHKAGGPFVMNISGSNTISIKDIYLGDVWICAGQSNMELPMERVQDKYPDEIAHADNNLIRQFEVTDKYNFQQAAEDVAGGKWVAVNPQSIRSFSAAGYFFAKEIYKKYKVPVGLINTALGGSPAQAWLSKEALKQFPDYLKEAEKFKDNQLIQDIESADTKRGNEWYAQLNQSDIGLKENWKSGTTDVSGWSTMDIPGYWAAGSLGAVNGSVWFHKSVTSSDAFVGKELKLLLGRIVDADSVFVNGMYVGNTTYLYPPRRYMIPPGVWRKGQNEIVIRVINSSGQGGFVTDKPYCLIAGSDTLNLQGLWKYKLGAEMPALGGSTFIRWKPEGLYNGMIAPITLYKMKGILWYQGESNAGKPAEYFDLMKTLITSWRSQWNEGPFPFIFVQLANFMDTHKEPVESNWAALREGQRQTLTVPNTGMAVAIDIGEWNDIHPLDKENIGKRLALQAFHLAYNQKGIVYSGPLFESMQQKGKELVLSFSNAGGGLQVRGNGGLQHFAIAGADKKYVWADAKIVGDKVVLGSASVAKPVYVRYAWDDNPAGANLYNKEGLPASPFEGKLP